MQLKQKKTEIIQQYHQIFTTAVYCIQSEKLLVHESEVFTNSAILNDIAIIIFLMMIQITLFHNLIQITLQRIYKQEQSI